MTRITIDDDMIGRFVAAVERCPCSMDSWSRARAALQAALDRRTGPKDRRVEWDDVTPLCRARSPYCAGRRDYDVPGRCMSLPRKSDRLKREAGERGQ